MEKIRLFQIKSRKLHFEKNISTSFIFEKLNNMKLKVHHLKLHLFLWKQLKNQNSVFQPKVNFKQLSSKILSCSLKSEK